MENVLYEVAVLTRHTKHSPDGADNHGRLLGQRDPLMSEACSSRDVCQVESEQASSDWFNPLEQLDIPMPNKDDQYWPGVASLGLIDQKGSEGFSEYVTAQETLTTDYSNEISEFDVDGYSMETADILNLGGMQPGRRDGAAVKPGSFMGLLAEKLAKVEVTDDNYAEIGLNSKTANQAEISDVDSEAYFSASSHQLDDAFGQCSGLLLSSSTSGHCSRSSSISQDSGHGSRSSSLTSMTSRSRSPSVGNASNPQPISLDCLCDTSEDNFGDVESLECLSQPFSTKRKKQLRMRKSKQQLGTIFSPSVKHANRSLSIKNPNRLSTEAISKEKESHESESSECIAIFNSCQSSSESFCPSSSNFTESSSGNTTESSLNPLCSPFVPRSMKSAFNYSSASQTDYDSSLEKHLPNETRDSGFGNATNLTMDQSVLTNNRTMNESAFFSEQNATKDQFANPIIVDRDISVTTDRASKYISNEPEYECKVKHSGDEFCSLEGFSVNHLPVGYQNYTTWKTITTMSHRVVRLGVAKLNTAVDSLSDIDEQDSGNCETVTHYGTGFAHYIGTDFVEIRTHIKLVSSPKDAENAQVTFSLLKENGHQIDFNLKGQKDDFYCNRFDQSSTFRCRANSQILENYHLFEKIPIFRKQSSFQDSSYFSDISQESNSCSSMGSNIPDATDIEIQRGQETVESVIGSLGIFEDSSIYDRSSTCKSDPTYNEINNQFTYPTPDEKYKETAIERGNSTWSGFHYNLSRLTELQSFTPPSTPPSTPPCKSPSKFPSLSTPVAALQQVAQEECPSPLRVMEKRRTKMDPGVCPYKDDSLFQSVGEYKCFSSYASDVISECLPSFPAMPNLSPFAHLPEYADWEMAGLLHAQTHQRDAYDRLYRYKTPANASSRAGHGINSNRTKPSQARKSIMEHKPKLDYLDNGLDSWDLDLINLDTNFNPLPPYTYLNDLAENVKPERDQWKGGQSPRKDAHAVIISFPHGGQKAVSFGHFSAHHHVGGDLYDTPTCMGSCGAPIITVRPGEGVAYVSNLVHAGSCRVNEVSSGIGVAHFDDHRTLNNQTIDILCK